jgi:hypothetical protein
LSRIVRLENSGNARRKLTSMIVIAVRQLIAQQEVDDSTSDLAAFIALALDEIHDSIEETVTAWEKRGYWIKADRFRLEWEWCDNYGTRMKDALQSEDWDAVAMLAARIAEKLSHVKIPNKHRMGEPWIGAYKRLKQLYSSG